MAKLKLAVIAIPGILHALIVLTMDSLCTDPFSLGLTMEDYFLRVHF